MAEPAAPAVQSGCSWWCWRRVLPGLLLLATLAFGAWRESPLQVVSFRVADAPSPATQVEESSASPGPTDAQPGAAQHDEQAAALRNATELHAESAEVPGPAGAQIGNKAHPRDEVAHRNATKLHTESAEVPGPAGAQLGNKAHPRDAAAHRTATKLHAEESAEEPLSPGPSGARLGKPHARDAAAHRNATKHHADAVVSRRPAGPHRGGHEAAAPREAPKTGAATSKSPAGRCRALRRPPYQIHGKFESVADVSLANVTMANVSLANISLTREELESARLSKRYPAFEAFLKKLASGARVRIAIIGGSFTKGGNCTQVLADGQTVSKWECSWPMRLKHWMQEFFPGANVTYLNWIRSATPTCSHLAVLPLTLQFHMRAGAIDLALLETLVNGAQKVKEDHLCYEQVLRTFRKLSPRTAVFSVFAGSAVFWQNPKMWRVAVEEVHVVRHYSVPYVNFAALVRARPELWMAPDQQTPVHPMWPSHQMLADLVAEAWGAAWAAACAGPPKSSAIAHGLPNRTYFDQRQLSRWETCLHPVSSYSADQPDASYHGNVTGASPRLVAGNWTLYEDRPGKPGWISTETQSVISFQIAFSKKPALVVMYLRSYESLGNALVTLQPQNNTVRLKGTWAERASQADILRLVAGAQWDLYTKEKFRLPPGGAAEVHITNTGKKFKVLAVFSC